MFLLKVLLTSMLLLGLGVLVHDGVFSHFTNSHWVANYLKEHDHWGLLSLIAFGALFTTVGGPRQIISFVFSYALGAPLGISLSLLSCLIGSLCSFYIARFTLNKWLHQHFTDQITHLDNLLHKRGWIKILIIRLFPIGNSLLTNLLAGASHIETRGFVLGTVLGYLPQTLIFSYAGSGVGFEKSENLIISGFFFLISSIIGICLYKQEDELSLREVLNLTNTKNKG